MCKHSIFYVNVDIKIHNVGVRQYARYVNVITAINLISTQSKGGEGGEQFLQPDCKAMARRKGVFTTPVWRFGKAF